MRGLFKSIFGGRPDREMVLYAHFPCFDGIASAVLAKITLEMGSKAAIRKVIPVTYDMRSRWLDTRLEKHSVVVDFLFHPEAEYWADHHSTTFLTKMAAEAFHSGAAQKNWLYDSSAPSCCSLIWRSCGAVVESRKRFEELVSWADKIDSAAYTSVEEAIFGEHPALRINASLLVEPDAAYFQFLVGHIAQKGLSATAECRQVRLRVRKARRMIARGLRVAKSVIRLEGDVAVLRADESTNSVVTRYAPYLFFPNARYSIMSSHFPGGTKITAMRNPWIQFQSVPLGPLFSRFGGGGHDRVGSVDLRNGAISPEEVLTQVLRELRSQEAISHRESVFA